MDGRDWSLEERQAAKRRQAEFRRRLGARIRDLRLAKAMSQERLALEADLTQFQISQIESGKRNPSITTVWSIATGLETTLASLLDGL